MQHLVRTAANSKKPEQRQQPKSNALKLLLRQTSSLAKAKTGRDVAEDINTSATSACRVKVGFAYITEIWRSRPAADSSDPAHCYLSGTSESAGP